MLSHLIELRRRSIQIIAVFAAFFILFFCYANHLFIFAISPLIKVLPAHDTLIATQITTPLMTPIQLAFDAAMFTTCPFALLQLWRFIEPGLYKNERSHLKGIAILSLILFCLGAAFCFYIVLPFILRFFASAVPAGVRFMPDMAYAIHFITRMLLLFGLSFQVPLVCLLLVRLSLISISTLEAMRPYVIVTAFTLGMVLTPPDVLSQVLLAVPLYLLYELGIMAAKLLPSHHLLSDKSDSL